MRKTLISIIVCLVLVITIIFMVRGWDTIEVKGFLELNEKNQEVEDEISRLNNVINITYKKATDELEKSKNSLIETKTKCENKTMEISSGDAIYAKLGQPYDIDYLWTKIGNYAKDEKVVIKIDVVTSTLGEKLAETYKKAHQKDGLAEKEYGIYDLNFTVVGGYVNITNFIYDIENNSKLGFKIDNFSMSSAAELTATFTCEKIPIYLGKLEADKNNEENETNNNTTSNSTANNTTNNNTTDNTTNNTTSNKTTNNTTTKNTTSNNTTTNNTSSNTAKESNTTKNEAKTDSSLTDTIDGLGIDI